MVRSVSDITTELDKLQSSVGNWSPPSKWTPYIPWASLALFVLVSLALGFTNQKYFVTKEDDDTRKIHWDKFFLLGIGWAAVTYCILTYAAPTDKLFFTA